MLIDLKQSDPAANGWDGLADICIIGSGPAGSTLARRLMGRGRKIILLESGGLDYEPDVAALNAGRSVGMPYYDLEDSRLRFFGGTAAIWGGRCAELDDIDFERRAWVPYSGWPFGKQVLAPYYAEARRHLQLDNGAADARIWSDIGLEPPSFGRGLLTTAFWRFDDAWNRFGPVKNADLINHPDVTVVLHASATGLELCESGSAVTSVVVASLSGYRGRVRAKAFVLAAGGLENPRILLASRDRAPEGVGNEHDLVGRFFMEHPHARGGRLHVRKLWSFLQTFRSSHSVHRSRCAALLRPDDSTQREHQILNSSFTPRVRPHPGSRRGIVNTVYRSIRQKLAPTNEARSAWRLGRHLARALKRQSDPLQPWLSVRMGRQGLYLSVRAEQAPNRDSRVRVGQERDALGMPRVELDWRLSDIDKRTVQVLTAQLDTRLRRENVGSVEPASWLSDPRVAWEIDPLISAHAIGGYHHMGTTRMATDPSQGVVDPNCRVHGISNLFIAGSSVFPTSGWANPTLTIMALSIRLGDHLQHEIGRLDLH